MAARLKSPDSPQVHTDKITGYFTLDEGLQRIKGWVFNPAEPTDSQWVEILGNNRPIATLHANLERADLAGLNTGYTRYGFDFLFPANDNTAVGDIEIEVRHRGSGACLPSNSKTLRTREVSETTIPVQDIGRLASREVFGSEARVTIDSHRWHGDPGFRDQLIGCNGKTARRVGNMRVDENGCWEYTKTIRYYRIRDALVVMPFGMIIVDGGLIRGNLGLPPPHAVSPILSRVDQDSEDPGDDWLQTALEVRLRLVDDAVHQVDHPALLMSAPKYQGYNHWHVDVLPILAEALRLPPRSVQQVLAPGCPTTWHEDSLRLAQSLYPEFEFREFSRLSVLRVKELIFTTGLAGNGCYLSPILTGFYQRLASILDYDDTVPDGRHRLYLSRRDYPRRGLANEVQIEQALASLGFQVIDPATLAYEEQIRLFREADFIVSPHGAALTNLLFCREGVKVVELFADCYTNLGLQRLANLKRARYGYLVGNASRDPSNPGTHNFTYTINVDALVHLIVEMDR